MWIYTPPTFGAALEEFAPKCGLTASQERPHCPSWAASWCCRSAGSDEGKALLSHKCATSPGSGRCCYIAAFVVAMVADGNKETTVSVHKARYRCSPLILCAPHVLLWRASEKTSCAIFRERNKEREVRAVHEDTGAHVFAEGALSGHADCVARDLFARELRLRRCRVAGKR